MCWDVICITKVPCEDFKIVNRENVIHFLIYFLLTTLLGLFIPILFVALLVITGGMTKEIVYDQADGGVSDLYNILANIGGIITGWFLLAMI